MVLPLPFEEEELDSGELPEDLSLNRLSPWVYHVILCQTATIHHRFNRALHKTPHDLDVLVKDADEALASIIERLPNHLQPSMVKTSLSHDVEDRYPWLQWQRLDLTTNLFSVRATINYQCRRYWDETQPICPGHRTYTLRLYYAGLIIGSEIPRSQDARETAILKNDLSDCISLLQQATELNEEAENSVEHLIEIALALDVP
ncbi:hypothetical protein H2202_009974 [Exophiala xenobiotica]|nr:hypothetical protein H2202_009974 [Exophiala xenobiotica]